MKDNEKLFAGVLHRKNDEGEFEPVSIQELSKRVVAAEAELEPDSIDTRRINCACGNNECKIGLSFDEFLDDQAKKKFIMRLVNKFGRETAMHIDRKTADDIISNLRDMKKRLEK